MKRMGIDGMTGNKSFLNSVLVLDTRNKKFGVLHIKREENSNSQD
jgi:hypothetical protein